MSATNGRADGSELQRPNGLESAVPAVALRNASASLQLPPEELRAWVAELEVPFDPSVIDWRVTNTAKDKKRGQIIPYADQRAYTDRLNALFTVAGWTREYTVHTSANFQRSKDQKTVAKVFVTCALTIFGIGSHSATGEEWTDDENAGTSAEAQAFKRACSCFGLGRYLYHFTGTWVDLDERKRPKVAPKLFGWATPKGWRDGLRPPRDAETTPARPEQKTKGPGVPAKGRNDAAANVNQDLVREIEDMAKPLGKGLYRGLLKTIARAWKPQQIQDAAVLGKLLTHMQAADRGLLRLKAALERCGPESVNPVLSSLKLKSLEQVDNLETLQKIVAALEAKGGSSR